MRTTRRKLLTSAAAGLAAVGNTAKASIDFSHHSSFIQRIDRSWMYVTHYSFFEEPDPGIPKATYIDDLGQANPALNLGTPIAQQNFQRSSTDARNFIQTFACYKTMPYGISPPGFSQEAPSQVITAFQNLLGGKSAADVRRHLTTHVTAVGQFQLPYPDSITAVVDGRVFRVSKQILFRVRIRSSFVYDDGDRSPLGVLLPYVTNGQAGDFLGVKSVPNRETPLTYEWGALLTMSTENQYRRAIATEPPPAADAFSSDLTEIKLVGSRIDDAGRYTIVGSAARPNFINPPFSSVAEIIPILFGTGALTDTELAYAESGVLIPGL